MLQHQPASSKHLYKLVKQFSALINDDYYHNTAEKWLQALYTQALNLRDIGLRVQVIEGDGRRIQVDRVWLERETDILNLPMQVTERDEEYFQLSGELDDYLLDEKNRASRRLSVHFPHMNRPRELEAGNGLLREWVALLKNKRCMDTEAAWEDHPEAMKAAEQLVVLTGFVPGGDLDLSASVMDLVL